MRFLLSIFLLSFTFCFAIGQTHELVSDFSPGVSGSFSDFSISAVVHNNKIITTMETEDTGDELGVVENGELALLIDFVPGPDDSSPALLTKYNDKVYFVAVGPDGTGKFLETDGTESGTMEIPLPGSSSFRPNGLIVADSGLMYLSYNGSILSFDGTSITEVGAGFLGIFSAQNNANYCLYKDEIAFIVEEDDRVKLKTIENGEIIELASTDFELEFFSDYYGLSRVDGGLLFSTDDANDDSINATFFYNEADGTLSKLTINNAEAVSRRLYDLSGSSALAWIGGEGYYMLNGTDNGESLVHEQGNTSLVQGEPIHFQHRFGNTAMYSYGGIWEDDFLVFYDGNSNTPTVLQEVDPFPSNIISYNNFAIFTFGTSNGFDPEMFWVNMEDGSYSSLYQTNLSSLDTRSVFLLGVVDDFLYFNSNLDAEVGRELYRLDLTQTNIISSTRNIGKDIDITQYQNGIVINSESLQECEIIAYTMQGQRVYSDRSFTNAFIDLSFLSGACTIEVKVDKGSKSFVFISR